MLWCTQFLPELTPFFRSVFSSGISHSVTSDMQTIEQETPIVAKPRKKYSDDSDDSYFISSSRYRLKIILGAVLKNSG